MDENEFVEQLRDSLDYSFGQTEQIRAQIRHLNRAAALVVEGMILQLPKKERERMLDEDKAMLREAVASAFCRIHALPHPLHIFVDTNMRKRP